MEKCNAIRATSVFNKKNEFDWTGNGRLIEIELVETMFNDLNSNGKKIASGFYDLNWKGVISNEGDMYILF